MLAASVLLSGVSLFPVIDSTDDWQLYNANQVMGYSENNAIYPLIKGEKISYSPGRNAFTFNTTELGARYQHFSLSLFYRYEWYLKFTNDTMRFYGETLNKETIRTAEVYNIDLRVEHLVSRGIKAAWTSDVSKPVIFHFAASYLDASAMMSGRLQGFIGYAARQRYDGLLELDYTYSRDALLKRDVSAPSSHFGYSTDVGVTWRITQHLAASVMAQDVMNAISWQAMPYTIATANTATTEIDANGFVSIKPLVNGIEGFRDDTQRLPVKYSSRLGYEHKNQTYSLKSLYVNQTWLTDLEWLTQWRDSIQTQLRFNLQTGAVGADVQWRGFSIGMQADNFDYQQATLLQFHLGVALNF